MGLLSGKKILLGISGGIAAYKTPLLVRILVRHGAEVQVVMTSAAKDFVSPLTLSTLSRRPVFSNFTALDSDNPTWNDHVALGNWCDLFLVAPATSNTLSAMAHAKCNNLLIATYLSVRCAVFVAPSMDLEMYTHPATKKNIELISSYGNRVLPVGEGFLVSGEEGKGRMLEPEEITQYLIDFFNPSQPLSGKKVLITAGPTYEAIDPVRFIGNHASGKTGIELAQIAVQLGAEVILILGPTTLKINRPNIKVIRVTSADEMLRETFKHYENVNIAIAAAAVADFKPANVPSEKTKKEQLSDTIKIAPNVDVLAEMGKSKKGQFLVGFALETDNGVENALKKLERKNLDAIVLNLLNDKEGGFRSDRNKITFIHADKRMVRFDLKQKSAVASDIFSQILEVYA